MAFKARSGPKGAKVPSGSIVIPGGLVSIGPGKMLQWELDSKRVRRKTPSEKMLNHFVQLWQGRPKNILAFAERWGPLRINAEGAPVDSLSGSEPLAAWIFLSRRAYAVWRIAKDLDAGRGGNTEDWALLSTPYEGTQQSAGPFYGFPDHAMWEHDKRTRLSGYRNAAEYSKATIASELTAWLQRYPALPRESPGGDEAGGRRSPDSRYRQQIEQDDVNGPSLDNERK